MTVLSFFLSCRAKSIAIAASITPFNVTAFLQEILEQTNYYVTYYSVLSFMTILMRVFSIVFISAGAYLAAKSLHINMLDNIVSIPMR